MKNNSNYKVAIYIRLSKEDKDDKENKYLNESDSITNQRNILMSFVQENGYELYDEYVDDGISGTTFDRDGFNRMIKDIEDKKVNMVITKDTSRLGRNNAEFSHYTETYFPEHNIRYISVLDGIDTFLDNPANEMLPFKGLMNDWYSRDTSRKIIASLDRKKRDGLYLGSYCPYGYIRDPKDKYHLIVDENVRDIIKLIYQKYLDGYGLGRIANYLTDKKIPTPSVYKKMNYNKGRKTRNIWDERTISDILYNQMYIGNLVQNRRRKVSYKSKKMITNPKEKWIVVENTHEAIIDKDIFEQVQRIREVNGHRSLKTHELLLRGFLYCKECGHTIGINLSSDKKRYYTVCNHYRKYSTNSFCTSHTMRYDDIENCVLNEIKNMCKSYINAESLEEILKNNNEKQKKLNEIDSKIVKCEGIISSNREAIKTAYKDRATKVIDLDTFKDIYNTLISEINDNEKTIKELKLKKQDIVDNKIYDNINCKKLVEEYLSFDKPNRIIISNIIDKITIDKDKKIDIYYKIQPFID